jgi:hypothetical protein
MAVKENKSNRPTTLYFDTPVGHPKDRIIINESSDIPKEGQFISLNGYPFLIKPGHAVDIPRPVRMMLDTRIRTEIKQDESTGKEYRRDIPRITYQLIQENVDASDSEPDDTAKSSEGTGEGAESVFN